MARAHVAGSPPAPSAPSRNGHGRASEAEDVLQESALRAWRDLARLDRPERFLPWICAIVQHTAIDRGRRERLRASREVPDLPEPERGPSERRRLRLLEAVEALPGPLRQVVELAYFADLSYREIAETVEASVSTVNLRLARARAALRAALEDEHE